MKIGKSSTAFTIVELLVVIAIIGVLMALLLPAVQAARESGRRTACLNNLTQLALGLTRRDQNEGSLPSWSNTITVLNRDKNMSVIPPVPVNVSWPIMVLPYVEQINFYEAWKNSTATTPPSISPIQLFQCPSATADVSNTAGAADTLKFAWPLKMPPGPLAYAGNCGTGAVGLPAKHLGVFPPPGTSYSLSGIAEGDGLSTTLLYAEKCGGPYQANWGINSIHLPGAYTTFSFQLNNVSSQMQLPAFGMLPAGIPTSQHPSGIAASFCDGHTKVIPTSIDEVTYTQLITSRNRSAFDAAGGTYDYRRVPPDGSKY